MCQGRSTPYIGDGKNPTFNDGNPYNGALKNPYGIGLMSLSPIFLEMSWELIDPRRHI